MKLANLKYCKTEDRCQATILLNPGHHIMSYVEGVNFLTLPDNVIWDSKKIQIMSKIHEWVTFSYKGSILHLPNGLEPFSFPDKELYITTSRIIFDLKVRKSKLCKLFYRNDVWGLYFEKLNYLVKKIHDFLCKYYKPSKRKIQVLVLPNCGELDSFPFRIYDKFRYIQEMLKLISYLLKNLKGLKVTRHLSRLVLLYIFPSYKMDIYVEMFYFLKKEEMVDYRLDNKPYDDPLDFSILPKIIPHNIKIAKFDVNVVDVSKHHTCYIKIEIIQKNAKWFNGYVHGIIKELAGKKEIQILIRNGYSKIIYKCNGRLIRKNVNNFHNQRVNFYYLEFNPAGALPHFFTINERRDYSYRKLNLDEIGFWTKLCTLDSLIYYKKKQDLSGLDNLLQKYPLESPENPLLYKIYRHLFNSYMLSRKIDIPRYVFKPTFDCNEDFFQYRYFNLGIGLFLKNPQNYILRKSILICISKYGQDEEHLNYKIKKAWKVFRANCCCADFYLTLSTLLLKQKDFEYVKSSLVWIIRNWRPFYSILRDLEFQNLLNDIDDMETSAMDTSF